MPHDRPHRDAGVDGRKTGTHGAPKETAVTTMTSEIDLSRTTPRSGFWASYGSLWRHVPGQAVYLLLVFVLAMTSVSVLPGLFFTGVGLLVLVIGLPLVVLSLLVARGFGIADRFLLGLTGLPAVREPEWNHDEPGANGFWRTLTRPLRVARYWLYLLHGAVVNPIVSTISFGITVVWLSLSLGGLTYWFWGAFIPRDEVAEWGRYVADGVPWLFGGWNSWTVEVVLYLAAGVVFAFTLPWVMRGLALAHHAIADGMLGRSRSDDLVAEVRAEAAARAAAVQAEDAALRRLERDIHDGPQQRLVRLQMDLAALERRANAGDGEAAAELAREAAGHAQAALAELRALSSGVAPPLLQDRGLSAALQAVGESCALPVNVELAPNIDGAVSPEVARTVYFTVAELLTNAVKHSGATAATVRVWVRQAEVDAPGMLDVWVVDNGRGGADPRPGHGLAGLQERIAGLRGELTIDSPSGGPTAIGVQIPLAVPTA
jgi:signal transduction histidine kinase